MPTREQMTHERVEAILEILEAEGIVDGQEKRLLRSNREFREAPELAKGMAQRAGRGNGSHTDDES